jgi:hypothetical protein
MLGEWIVVGILFLILAVSVIDIGVTNRTRDK